MLEIISYYIHKITEFSKWSVVSRYKFYIESEAELQITKGNTNCE